MVANNVLKTKDFLVLILSYIEHSTLQFCDLDIFCDFSFLCYIHLTFGRFLFIHNNTHVLGLFHIKKKMMKEKKKLSIATNATINAYNRWVVVVTDVDIDIIFFFFCQQQSIHFGFLSTLVLFYFS